MPLRNKKHPDRNDFIVLMNYAYQAIQQGIKKPSIVIPFVCLPKWDLYPESPVTPDIIMMEILQKHSHRDLLDLLPYFCDANFNCYLSGDNWKALVNDFIETGHCHNSEEFVNTYHTHSNHAFNDGNTM